MVHPLSSLQCFNNVENIVPIESGLSSECYQVFADNQTPYPQISIENVMLTQPEIIILPNEKSKKPQPKINWAKWPEIPAVKNNYIIEVNADLLHRYSTRMLDGLEDMCFKIDQFR